MPYEGIAYLYGQETYNRNDPSCRCKRLMSAHKLGHTGDISKQMVSVWVWSLIKQAYLAVEEEDFPHLTYTKLENSFHQSYSLKHVMEAASWRKDNTFVSYLKRHFSNWWHNFCRSVCSRSEVYFRLAIRLLFGQHPLPSLPLILQPELQKR